MGELKFMPLETKIMVVSYTIAIYIPLVVYIIVLEHYYSISMYTRLEIITQLWKLRMLSPFNICYASII